MGMMTLNRQLSNKIRILREINNYTQKYVANILEISQNTYSMIERGETRLTMDIFEIPATLAYVCASVLLQTDMAALAKATKNARTLAATCTPRCRVCAGGRAPVLAIIGLLQKRRAWLRAVMAA